MNAPVEIPEGNIRQGVNEWLLRRLHSARMAVIDAEGAPVSMAAEVWHVVAQHPVVARYEADYVQWLTSGTVPAPALVECWSYWSEVLRRMNPSAITDVDGAVPEPRIPAEDYQAYATAARGYVRDLGPLVLVAEQSTAQAQA